MSKTFGILDSIKNSFKIIFEEPSIIGILLLPFLVAIVFFSITVLLQLNSFLCVITAESQLILSPSFIFTTIIVMLICLWISMIGVAAVIIKVNAKLNKKKIKVFDTLKLGFNISWRLFTAYLIKRIIVLAGFILFIVPGIYFTVKLILLAPACVLEKRGFGLKKSWMITENNFWKIFLILILWVIAFLITIRPYLILSWIILFPVFLTNLTLIYLKLRKRR